MRNYLQEMDQLLATESSDPEAAPLTAVQLVARLRAEDPGLLAGWLDAMAAVHLAQTIHRRARRTA